MLRKHIDRQDNTTVTRPTSKTKWSHSPKPGSSPWHHTAFHCNTKSGHLRQPIYKISPIQLKEHWVIINPSGQSSIHRLRQWMQPLMRSRTRPHKAMKTRCNIAKNYSFKEEYQLTHIKCGFMSLTSRTISY